MGCTVKDVIKDLRCTLVDTDASCYAYDDCVLEGAIRQAAAYIAAIRPDLNSETKIIELKPGCYQEFCSDDCTRVLDVRAEDGSCEKPGSFDAGKIDYVDALFDDICKNSQDFTPGKWKPDENNPCAGWLTNPVPDKGVFKAMVICSGPIGDITGDSELPAFICDEYYGILIDMILSRVYLIDHEDRFDEQRSARHYSMAQDGIQQKLLIDFAQSQPDWSIYRRKSND